MKHLPLILVSLLLLGVLGYGARQYAELRQARASLAAHEKERQELREKLWALQKKPVESKARPMTEGEVVAAAGDGAVVVAENADGVGAREHGRRGDGGRMGAFMDSPEVQRLMSMQQKAGLDGRYAALFRALGLPPEKLEQFKSLLVDKQAAVMDVFAAARAQGIGGREGRDEIQALLQSTQAEIDGQIRSLLGDTGYAQFQNYERTQPQRAVVGQLEQRLSYTGAPLNSAQSEQLVQILAQHGPPDRGANRRMGSFVQSFVGGGSVAAQFIGGGGPTITDAAVAQAQTVLSPPQVASLQQLQQEQLAAAQLQRQMRESFGGRNNTGGTPRPATPAAPITPPGG